MGVLTEFVNSLPSYVGTVLVVLIRVFSVLFIFFSTKYRNGEHKLIYYILVIIFPLIGVIVFASNRKTMYGVGMNKCPSCGSLYPSEFKVCYKCNVELLPYNEKKAKSYKALALAAVVIFGISYVSNDLIAVVEIIDNVNSFFDDETVYARIGFEDENGNTVYYDRKGKAYDDPNEIAFYTRDDVKYVYNSAIERYSGSDGTTMSYYSAFVDSDGYIVKNENDSIYYSPISNEEDETQESGNSVSFLSPENDEESDDWYYVDYDKPYYMSPYKDDDGNVYYPADVASWTKDGKLITSAKDCE